MPLNRPSTSGLNTKNFIQEFLKSIPQTEDEILLKSLKNGDFLFLPFKTEKQIIQTLFENSKFQSLIFYVDEMSNGHWEKEKALALFHIGQVGLATSILKDEGLTALGSNYHAYLFSLIPLLEKFGFDNEFVQILSLKKKLLENKPKEMLDAFQIIKKTEKHSVLLETLLRSLDNKSEFWLEKVLVNLLTGKLENKKKLNYQFLMENLVLTWNTPLYPFFRQLGESQTNSGKEKKHVSKFILTEDEILKEELKVFLELTPEPVLNHERKNYYDQDDTSIKLEISEENLSTILLSGRNREIEKYISQLIKNKSSLKEESKMDILSWFLSRKKFVEALEMYENLDQESKKEFSEINWEIIKGIDEKDK